MPDLVRRNSQALGRDAREHRGMTLAGRLHVERQHQRVVAGEIQRRRFLRQAAGMLQEAGDADATILAARLGGAPPQLEPVIIVQRQRLI